MLKADQNEAGILTSLADPVAAARRLCALGAATALLTHKSGVVAATAGALAEASFGPYPMEGRTGRGDTCTSSYLSRRLTAPPADAVLWAAAVTSLKLEAEGPFRRDLKDVEALYNRMRRDR